MTCRTISITKSIEVCDSYPLLELTYNFNFIREGEEKSKTRSRKFAYSSLKEITSAKELFLRR